MKDQGKNPPDQTNEEEIGSLPEKEFRVMIVKMIQNLGNRMEKIQETFNMDLEELKSKQTMMNNTINEIQNSLEGINSRITEAEERINDLEDKIVEITTTERNKEKRMKRIEDRGFPGGAVVENLPANAGDTGSSPGLGRSPCRGATRPVSHNY